MSSGARRATPYLGPLRSQCGSESDVAAADGDALAGDVVGEVGDQEFDDFGAVFGHAQAAEGDILQQAVAHFGAVAALGDGAGGEHKAGRNTVDMDVVRAQFGGEDAGVVDHAGFGDFVGHAAAVASAPEAGLGCDVDDLAAARGLHIGRGGLAAEDCAGQVDVEDVAVVIGRRGGGAMVGRGMEHAAGVVDEDVDPPEGVYGLAQHGLHRGFVGHVGLDAQRAAAERLHFVRRRMRR